MTPHFSKIDQPVALVVWFCVSSGVGNLAFFDAASRRKTIASHKIINLSPQKINLRHCWQCFCDRQHFGSSGVEAVVAINASLTPNPPKKDQPAALLALDAASPQKSICAIAAVCFCDRQHFSSSGVDAVVAVNAVSTQKQ